MSTEDKMTIDERLKYLRMMKKRYVKAARKEKGRLLDEMQAVTELHRKTLIDLINGELKRKPRKKQRGRIYGPEVDDALRVIDKSFDYICAERLTPNLVWMAQHLARHSELETSDLLLERLGRISVSSVGRILGRIRQDQPRLPRKGPRRANKLVRDIPMIRLPWNILVPGRFEVDRSAELTAQLGSPLRPHRFWRVYVYATDDRRSHRLERTGGCVGTQLLGYGRRLSPHYDPSTLPSAGNPP